MENSKNLISLHWASKISGYHQDYLSALVRKNEIRGVKMGGTWFTTEAAVKNYIFKQKIRHRELAIRDFLSFRRTKKIFVVASIILVIVALSWLYFYGKKNSQTLSNEVNTKLSTDVEVIQ